MEINVHVKPAMCDLKLAGVNLPNSFTCTFSPHFLAHAIFPPGMPSLQILDC